MASKFGPRMQALSLLLSKRSEAFNDWMSQTSFLEEGEQAREGWKKLNSAVRYLQKSEGAA